MSYIEAYLYSNGTSVHSSTNTLAVIETGGGGVSATVRLPASAVFSDAIADFQTLLNAPATGLNATYTITYSATTEQVTISASGGGVTAIQVNFTGQLGAVLGFSGNPGGALDHFGDLTPAGRLELFGIETDVPAYDPKVNLEGFRHGRAEATHFANRAIASPGLWVTREKSDLLLNNAYLCTGRVRVYQSSNANPISSTNAAGYLDMYVSGMPQLGSFRKDEGLVRADIRGPMSDGVAPVANTDPTVWTPVEFGWGVMYWLVVEGWTTLVSEGLDGAVTGKTLPTGFVTEDASLVIDKSAKIGGAIDRDKGIGTGYSLTFQLLDTSTIRDAFKRFTLSAKLSGDVTAAVNIIPVDDTSAWPAAGPLAIGNEHTTYTGKTVAPDTFTGVTRGVAGYAYPHKQESANGALVTNALKWWGNREVQLWASPIDPSGYMPGTNLDTDAEMIWRGRISEGPDRVGARWQFQALSLERTLANPLRAQFTGKVTSTEEVAIKKGSSCTLRVEGLSAAVPGNWGPHIFTVFPFAAYSDGDLLSATEMRAEIVSALNTQITTLGAGGDITSFEWQQLKTSSAAPGAKAGQFQMIVIIAANGLTTDIKTNGEAFGAQIQLSVASFSKGVVAGDRAITDWFTGTNPMLTNQGTNQETINLTIVLDSGDPADVPDSGLVEVGDVTYTYDAAEALENRLYLTGLEPVDGSLSDPGDPADETATITLNDCGTLSNVVRRCVESSGETALRGTYDTLTVSQGYAIDSDAVDDATAPNLGSIASVLDAGFAGEVDACLVHGRKSLVQLVGGMLGATATAVVLRQNANATNRRAQLMGVNTSPVGGGWTAEVTDAELLCEGNDPVRPRKSKKPANYVSIVGEQDGAETFRIAVQDRQSAQANGVIELEYKVPVADGPNVADAALGWALRRFAEDQLVQEVEIDVVPWLDIQRGDLIKFTTAHHAVWQWSTGTPGYTGLGRVIGHSRGLKSKVVTLGLLIDGLTSSPSLCPSSEVSAWSGAAVPVNNDTIDVERKHFWTFAKQLAEDSTLVLLHYRPGQIEGTGEQITFDAVVDTGAVCRLTVNGAPVGPPTLVAGSSRLCTPHTAIINTYQADNFMNDADGSRWG